MGVQRWTTKMKSLPLRNYSIWRDRQCVNYNKVVQLAISALYCWVVTGVKVIVKQQQLHCVNISVAMGFKER